jgi:predicted DNA-binding protein with PD1-like motif
MQSQVLRDVAGGKVYAVVFELGDEVLAGLQKFAEENKLQASSFSAVGAFSDVTLGWFDWEKKDYKRIAVKEQVEVLSLLGDVTLDKEKRKVHAHVVVGLSDGAAKGGHLLEGHVRPTLEVFVQETGGVLRRAYDPVAKIDLIRPG